MKIKEILWQHRYDYSATMVCEHCGGQQVDAHGYDDANYHDNVVPKKYCDTCHKNRAGDLDPRATAPAAPSGTIFVVMPDK